MKIKRFPVIVRPEPLTRCRENRAGTDGPRNARQAKGIFIDGFGAPNLSFSPNFLRQTVFKNGYFARGHPKSSQSVAALP